MSDLAKQQLLKTYQQIGVSSLDVPYTLDEKTDAITALNLGKEEIPIIVATRFFKLSEDGRMFALLNIILLRDLVLKNRLAMSLSSALQMQGFKPSKEARQQVFDVDRRTVELLGSTVGAEEVIPLLQRRYPSGEERFTNLGLF